MTRISWSGCALAYRLTACEAMSYDNLQLSSWIGGDQESGWPWLDPTHGDQESGWSWLDPTHGACSDGRRLLQTKDFIYGLVLSLS